MASHHKIARSVEDSVEDSTKSTCDEFRHVGVELDDAFEHVFRRVRREIRYPLVLNRQVRRELEKVVDPVRQMKVCDERAHEPRLANAGGQRETNGRKFALEIRVLRELRLMAASAPTTSGDLLGGTISVIRSRMTSASALRRAQAETSGNGVDVGVHFFFPINFGGDSQCRSVFPWQMNFRARFWILKPNSRPKPPVVNT